MNSGYEDDVHITASYIKKNNVQNIYIEIVYSHAFWFMSPGTGRVRLLSSKQSRQTEETLQTPQEVKYQVLPALYTLERKRGKAKRGVEHT